MVNNGLLVYNMSLVHYSDSDSEDSDSEQQQQSLQPQNLKKRGLSSLLPPPKKTKTIQIEAPKFVEDDEEEPTKPLRTSAGLGLADLLPAPKNYNGPAPITKTTTAFMPHALAKKLKGKEKAEDPKVQTEEDEKEVEEDLIDEQVLEKEAEKVIPTSQKFTGSFFRLSKDLKEEPVSKAVPKTVQPTPGPVYTVERPPVDEGPQFSAVDAYAYDPNAMYSTDPNAYYQYQQQYQQEYETVGNLDNGDDLQKLVGKRLKGEANIQIKTINQTDMLPSQEWREAQALTAAPKFNNGISVCN
ncbi:unnamed protein product [Mucor hiemalis]